MNQYLFRQANLDTQEKEVLFIFLYQLGKHFRIDLHKIASYCLESFVKHQVIPQVSDKQDVVDDMMFYIHELKSTRTFLLEHGFQDDLVYDIFDQHYIILSHELSQALKLYQQRVLIRQLKKEDYESLARVFDLIVEKVQGIRQSSEDALSLLEKGLLSLKFITYEDMTTELERKMLEHLIQLIKDITGVHYALEHVTQDNLRL
jgi:hypothetical protein